MITAIIIGIIVLLLLAFLWRLGDVVLKWCLFLSLLLLTSPAMACYAPFGSGGCGTDVIYCETGNPAKPGTAWLTLP